MEIRIQRISERDDGAYHLRLSIDGRHEGITITRETVRDREAFQYWLRDCYGMGAQIRRFPTTQARWEAFLDRELARA